MTLTTNVVTACKSKNKQIIRRKVDNEQKNFNLVNFSSRAHLRRYITEKFLDAIGVFNDV